jgi:orotate phosphoribosyltransferase
MFVSSQASEIAAELLSIGAVKLSPENPFRWASGWFSPIYCDNRLALSFPHTRTIVREALTTVARGNFPAAEVVAGVATAGIPQGVLVADALGLPFIYVRPKPKDHGLENLIEGKLIPGQKVLVIEDLISTGGSSLKAVDELRKAGADVIGMLAIFTYGFPVAAESFEKAGVPLVTLSDYPSLLKVAMEKGLVAKKDLESLEIWRKSPENWRVV